MFMSMTLKDKQIESVKNSYFNILAFFLSMDKVDTRYVRCLLKWGFQLQLTPGDIKRTGMDMSQISFSKPEEKIDLLESIYHLVQMIYIDKVIEDVELEVATIYAEKLGFKPSVVSGLFQSIATATYDDFPSRDVRKEVMDFLEIQSLN
jgi:hypothetical protein